MAFCVSRLPAVKKAPPPKESQGDTYSLESHNQISEPPAAKSTSNHKEILTN